MNLQEVTENEFEKVVRRNSLYTIYETKALISLKKKKKFEFTFDENDDLIGSLDVNRGDLQALNDLVTAKKKDIADTNKTIANLEKEILLGDEAQAKTAITASIARMQKDLVDLNTKITAAEKLANYWKALLDKIFTV